MYLDLLPKQFRGPAENGWKTKWLSFSYLLSLSFSHRSGLKESGSAKFCADRNAARWGIPTIVYDVNNYDKQYYHEILTLPGTQWPLIIAPVGGVVRVNAAGTG
jgi:hypothetical protein